MTTTDSSSKLAATFRSLHADGPILVLPNVWDAGSARLVEACGARAIATSSGALSWAHGAPDGEGLGVDTLIAATREIVRAVRVPVTVDVEAGYGRSAESVAPVIRQVIEAGAVGINLEDGSDSPSLLAGKIEVTKRTARELGVDLFVNARTDVYLRGLVPASERVAETLGRARQYRDAGCDGLFVPGVVNADEISALAKDAGLPLNVMVVAGLPAPMKLQELGVRRVSAGVALALAALTTVRREATRLLERGEYEGLLGSEVSYPEMNALLSRR